MVERFGWRMVKFTGLRGPAFCDLACVAAVLSTREPHTDSSAPELDITIGATIYLTGGQAFYVRESAETVFGEVHRYRTEPAPVPQPIRVSAAVPRPDMASEPVEETVAPGEEAGRQVHDG